MKIVTSVTNEIFLLQSIQSYRIATLMANHPPKKKKLKNGLLIRGGGIKGHSPSGNIKNGLLVSEETPLFRAVARNMVPMTNHHESTLRFFD